MHAPLVVDRLDDETERGTDSVDILAHNPLDDCCLARIIEPSRLSGTCILVGT